jgi:predicted PurR-regulated permease PerM
VVIAAALVVVVAGLKVAAELLLPLVVAVFLALLSLPLLGWLRRRHLPLVAAVALTILADVALLVAFGMLISVALSEFVAVAPDYLEQLGDVAETALDNVFFRGVALSRWLAFDQLDPQAVINVAGGIVGETVKGVAATFASVSVVLLLLIFFLLEAVGLPAKLRKAMGREQVDLKRYRSIIREIQRYLLIKTVVSAGTGVLVGAWTAFLGLDFAVLWGFLAFLLNYIPVIGSIVAGIPAVLLALVQLSLGGALAVAAGYLVINFLLGNLLEPAWMGRRLGLSTLVVFLSLLFWGWVWGPIGMIVSVPLTVAAKIMMEHSERLRWIAVLLGPNPVLAGEARAGE